MTPRLQQTDKRLIWVGYITYFMSLLGIKDYFTVSVVLYVVMLLSNIAAFPLIETAGRRPLLMYGMIVLTVVELVRIFQVCRRWVHANTITVDGYHGMRQHFWCTMGDPCLHFPLVGVFTELASADADDTDRALAYQVSIGAVGFALASEVSSPPLRPITISLVGITQGAV